MGPNIMIAGLLVTAAAFGALAAYGYLGARRGRSRQNIATAAKQAASALEAG